MNKHGWGWGTRRHGIRPGVADTEEDAGGGCDLMMLMSALFKVEDADEEDNEDEWMTMSG